MTSQLTDIVTRNGTFPAADLVIAGFEEAMAIAEAGSAPRPDLASAFIKLVDQLGNERTGVPPELGKRLTAWTETAADDPGVPASAIAFLLVNAGTERSYAVLQALAANAKRPDLRAAAAGLVPDHPLAPQPEDAQPS
ncbi:MAG TPA: hypothetical protein VHB27_07405 [Rhodopila sp.]|uniref:hypothetical protein n=1 Tax=Rhodopila sp. TaxID=2480087 RepID=UPI002BD20949|nr:hypothetical protein [Rhodopila sp.]HVY15036.1 hypothetical protein [Rhodopila sp.]